MSENDSAVQFPGPFKPYWKVVANGHQVPYLTADLSKPGTVELLLDGRFSLEVPVDEAETTVAFIANAIAVARGKACHPTAAIPDPPERNLTPLVMQLETPDG